VYYYDRTIKKITTNKGWGLKWNYLIVTVVEITTKSLIQIIKGKQKSKNYSESDIDGYKNAPSTMNVD